MINLGTSTMQDFALGDNLVERIDLGDTTIFDPYTTLTGALPLTFNSRAAVALKNYRIHGTAAGAGVETENLWDPNSKTTNQDGVVQPGVELPAGTYTIVNNSSRAVYSRDGVSSAAASTWVASGASATKTFDVGCVAWCTRSESNIVLVSGSTAPTSYIPFGYKIPILNTSGVTKNLVDVSEAWGKQNPDMNVTILDEENNKIKVEGRWYVYLTIDVKPNTDYYLKFTVDSYTVYRSVAIAGVNGTTIGSNISPASANPRSFNTGIYNKIALLFYGGNGTDGVSVYSSIMLTKGSTPPDHYIPHRYESNYDLFIGSTKLGEEEYVDYGEQKVYKRTENLFDKDAKDTNNGYINDTFLYSSGATRSNESYYVSEYIQINPNTVYFLKDLITTAVSASLCFYDNEKQIISGAPLLGLSNIVSPGNARYLRTSILKTNEDIAEITSLQPTDPPAPLPAIQTYQGENTLSSTETVGEVTVKGRISAISP